MNLILLLSALLSALSGGAGARGPQVPTTLSASVASAVKATVAVRLQVASRPVQTISGPNTVPIAAASDFALPAAIPAFASRRRE